MIDGLIIQFMKIKIRIPGALAPGLAFLMVVGLSSHPLPAGAESLQYRTTWVGNSFGGGPKWVQNFNDQMQVLPDGTVYLASFWDEGGREVGIY